MSICNTTDIDTQKLSTEECWQQFRALRDTAQSTRDFFKTVSFCEFMYTIVLRDQDEFMTQFCAQHSNEIIDVILHYAEYALRNKSAKTALICLECIPDDVVLEKSLLFYLVIQQQTIIPLQVVIQRWPDEFKEYYSTNPFLSRVLLSPEPRIFEYLLTVIPDFFDDSKLATLKVFRASADSKISDSLQRTFDLFLVCQKALSFEAYQELMKVFTLDQLSPIISKVPEDLLDNIQQLSQTDIPALVHLLQTLTTSNAVTSFKL